MKTKDRNISSHNIQEEEGKVVMDSCLAYGTISMSNKNGNTEMEGYYDRV